MHVKFTAVRVVVEEKKIAEGCVVLSLFPSLLSCCSAKDACIAEDVQAWRIAG